MVSRPAHLLNLGTVEYREALDLQHAIAAEVASGERPDTVLLLEHHAIAADLTEAAEEGDADR